MPEPVQLATFVAVMFGTALVPGPAAAYCLAAGLEMRTGMSFAAAGGVALGKLVHLGIASAGAFWVAQLHPGFRTATLGMAAAVMIGQGVRRWWQPTAGHRPLLAPNSSRLAQGFAISVINPQSLASSVAVLPLFVSSSTPTLVALSLVATGTVAVFAAYLVYEGAAVVAVRHLSARSQTRVVGATYVVAAAGLGLAAVM